MHSIIEDITSISSPINASRFETKVKDWLYECWRKSRSTSKTNTITIHLTPEEQEAWQKYTECLKKNPKIQEHTKRFSSDDDNDNT